MIDKDKDKDKDQQSGASGPDDTTIDNETEGQETPSTDIKAALIEAINSGTLVTDFKTKLALAGMMKDTDDLQVGKTGRTGQLHLAILNQRESSSTVKLFINEVLTVVKKEDFDKIYMQGVYAGSDLVLLTDHDDMILLRGAYSMNVRGELTIY